MATPTIGLESSAWEYDVFLSFRGENTRKTFTDHLYHALCQVGIRTFRDDEELRKGEYLAPELMRAIQSSRISMIVFSKDYASSRWCLDELVQILECKEKGKHIVFPIFYDVEPSEVRKQSGNYSMAFAKHEECFLGSDKVKKWRDALTKVANMSGWELQGIANGYESKFIDAIIKEVQFIVRQVPIFVVKHGVGLDYRVEHVVQLLLGEQNDGVRMIGIYGMGGIGKTTLAKAVYNRLFGYFKNSCFLEIESAISEQQNNGINLEKVNNQIKKLQKELFKKLFNEEIEVGTIGEGIMLMQKRLQAKKCFIVFDNLEHINQFNALCGERDWFGRGSRLILTTREVHVLKELKKDEHYEVDALNRKESLQLFTLHAFRGLVLPKEDYSKLLDGIVTYCGGIPLALEVLGAYLSDKSREEWISAFEKLKEIPNTDVQAKLKISYDGLPDNRTKSLFLDLVCFSNIIYKETIDTMGYFSTIEIRNLVDKCLINCHRSRISMHSLIREMGREIIRLESPNNPGERSRLWCPNDIHDVLIRQKGTKKIEVIVFNSPMKNMKYNTKAFKNMENLRFLQIDEAHLYGKFKYLSKELRCLRWNDCPLKYINIPSSCSFEKLVRLEMWNSNIKEFLVPLKYFPCLEFLDLTWSKRLTRTPDFSGAQKLRRLSFLGCSGLVKVHYSIGELWRLVYLNFMNCKRLEKLPNNLCKLSSLQSLNVSYSPKLKELPEDFRNLTSLQQLDLSKTKIYGLPFNLSHLFRLESIHLSSCWNLGMVQELPPNLRKIDLNGCMSLKMLPEFPPNFKEISLYGCKNLEMLPKLPPNLEEINLNGCENLKILQKLPPNLRKISLYGCKNLEVLSKLSPNLKEIILDGCKNLKMLPELPLSLWKINLNGCENLKVLPELPPNVRKISLYGCKNLKMLSKLSPNLLEISLDGCENLEMLQKLPLNLWIISLNGCENLKVLPKLPPNLKRILLDGCKNLKMLPKLPPNLREINLNGCKNLEMLPKLPPNLWEILLGGCENLKMLPKLPPNLREINLDGCKNLKILPKLPQKLEILSAKNCELMEKVPNLSNCMWLQELDLTGCRKLKEIKGWENKPLRVMKLGGVPHINFSESIKEVLIGSKLDPHLMKCTLTYNEIPSWIRCKEDGSSISFKWPLRNSENYTLEFLGFFLWVVFKAPAFPPLYCDYYITIENNGSKGDSWICVIQLEVEEISVLHFISRGYYLNNHFGLQDIKSGEVIKVTPTTTSSSTSVESCMVKKIGAEALYRDIDGFLQFVPITKVG